MDFHPYFQYGHVSNCDFRESFQFANKELVDLETSKLGVNVPVPTHCTNGSGSVGTESESVGTESGSIGTESGSVGTKSGSVGTE